MSAKHNSARGALIAVAVLVAGLVAGVVWPGLKVAFAGAGFVGYVWLSSRVVRDLDADPLVFAPRSLTQRRRAASSAIRAGLAAGTIGAFIAGRSASVWPGRERRRRPRRSWPGLSHTASPKTH